MKHRFLCGLFLSSISISTLSYAAEAPINEPVPALQATPSKIDLNTATASDLVHSIKGIGTKRAAAIIKYREAHHGFHALEELAQVPGLGKHFVEAHLTELQQLFRLSTPQ